MKMQNVPLTDIVPNPWRDLKLNPIDTDHVTELRASIKDHGFFGGIKGRRRNDKIEIGCGHARIAAARLAARYGGPETVPIFVEDMDDDAMVRLMTDENATQGGHSPGATLNEVAAVTRRIIEGLLLGRILPDSIARAFENEREAKRARTKLHILLTEPDKADIHLAIGHKIIARYLGQGDPKNSNRSEVQIRGAITSLKQAGRYDEMVEQLVRKYPPPVDAKVSKSRAVATVTKPKRPARILDERVAHLFPNENQFGAFREAITTEAAKKVVQVEQQYELAKTIMKEASNSKEFKNKHVGAPFIKKMVQHFVNDGVKKQRDLDKEEKEAYLSEQREERIESELHSANASLRSLLSALGRLQDLAREFPAHPKIGGFAARLDTLVGAINQFSKRIR